MCSVGHASPHSLTRRYTKPILRKPPLDLLHIPPKRIAPQLATPFNFPLPCPALPSPRKSSLLRSTTPRPSSSKCRPYMTGCISKRTSKNRVSIWQLLSAPPSPPLPLPCPPLPSQAIPSTCTVLRPAHAAASAVRTGQRSTQSHKPGCTRILCERSLVRALVSSRATLCYGYYT